MSVQMPERGCPIHSRNHACENAYLNHMDDRRREGTAHHHGAQCCSVVRESKPNTGGLAGLRRRWRREPGTQTPASGFFTYRPDTHAGESWLASTLAPIHALNVDFMQFIGNSALRAKIIDRTFARRARAIIVDDDESAARYLVIEWHKGIHCRFV